MAKVFITRKIHPKATEILSKHCEVEAWNAALPPSPELLKSKVKDCEGVICLLSDRFDKELIESCSKLKVISNYAVGYNNIDVEFCRRSGIRVGYTPDVLTDATADLALSLLMALNRKLFPSQNSILQGNWKTWEPLGFLGQDLKGKNLGIVGLGRIGAAFAKKCQDLYGMKVFYHSRSTSAFAKDLSATKMEWEDLLSHCDVISLHCKLTDETKNLMSAKEFALMKPTSYFINTARGEMHDEQSLIQILKQNKIAGAALDVTNPEPMSKDNPLLQMTNAIVTPHIGSATDKAREDMAIIAAQNVLGALKLGEFIDGSEVGLSFVN